ncbi:hypothetical protein LF1_22400 [Rubripirellula obstinata]|uniref:Uncharacterized protein n=1 Tax=Rubripirellula obstinata TaxID=406547 RepID=A0A5B1CJS9_9BACT|nr:hypothetical protein LF1_22400 [Rubripirellula obstinata]
MLKMGKTMQRQNDFWFASTDRASSFLPLHRFCPSIVLSKIRLTRQLLIQTDRLLQTKHHIHILNRRSTGSFSQVIDYANQDQSISANAN